MLFFPVTTLRLTRPPRPTLFPYTTLFRSTDRGYTRARAALPRKVSDPAFHKEPDALEFRDVLQRVALHRDQVGVCAGRHGAQARPAQELGRERRARLGGLQRRHAVLRVVRELMDLVE